MKVAKVTKCKGYRESRYTRQQQWQKLTFHKIIITKETLLTIILEKGRQGHVIEVVSRP
jgi:hypothetical protein